MLKRAVAFEWSGGGSVGAGDASDGELDGTFGACSGKTPLHWLPRKRQSQTKPMRLLTAQPSLRSEMTWLSCILRYRLTSQIFTPSPISPASPFPPRRPYTTLPFSSDKQSCRQSKRSSVISKIMFIPDFWEPDSYVFVTYRSDPWAFQ